MIGEDQVIVNGLGNADETDVAADGGCVPGQAAHRIHGVIAADIKYISDIQFLKFFKKLAVNRILQIRRKTVTAGTQVRTGRVFQPVHVLAAHPGQIDDVSFQKTFNAIAHAIYPSDLLGMKACCGNHTAQAGIDDSCGAAGLAHQQILHT